jgi:raffinose/stachyose/melibiose transport system permease protein
VPWLWVVPAVALVLAFRYATVVAGGWYAFTDWNGISPNASFVGLKNFQQILSDRVVRGALVNTITFAVLFVTTANLIGLALAVGLHRALKTRHVLRALFFAPVVMSPLATSFIWRFMFDFNGPINRTLKAAGLTTLQKAWLADVRWSFWAIFIVLVWQFVGLCMVMYLAGLQGIPEEIEEAAMIDGATSFQRFRKVTLPLLAPAMTISLELSLIYGLGVFDQVMALTNGGPAGATETLATQVYRQTFVFGRFGYGTALALVLTVLITVAAVVQLIVLRSREKEI